MPSSYEPPVLPPPFSGPFARQAFPTGPAPPFPPPAPPARPVIPVAVAYPSQEPLVGAAKAETRNRRLARAAGFTLLTVTSVCVWLAFAALTIFGYLIDSMALMGNNDSTGLFTSPIHDLNLVLGWVVPLTMMVVGLGFSPERYADRALVATGGLLMAQIAVLSISSILL